MIHEEYTNNFINRAVQFTSTQEHSAAEKNRELFENNLIKSHSSRNIRVL